VSLDDGASSSCGEMDHQQDDADDEEDPGDLRSDGRDAGGTQHTCNQTNDEKHERVIQHFTPPFRNDQKQKVCRSLFSLWINDFGAFRCWSV